MCICINESIYVCMWVCMYLYTCIYRHRCGWVYILMYQYFYVYECMCFIHECMHCVCVHEWGAFVCDLYAWICMYVSVSHGDKTSSLYATITNHMGLLCTSTFHKTYIWCLQPLLFQIYDFGDSERVTRSINNQPICTCFQYLCCCTKELINQEYEMS